MNVEDEIWNIVPELKSKMDKLLEQQAKKRESIWVDDRYCKLCKGRGLHEFDGVSDFCYECHGTGLHVALQIVPA